MSKGVDLEMANGCLDEIRGVLSGKGIDMSATPPMFYPEAIHCLYVYGVEAGAHCAANHKLHGGDPNKVGECCRAYVESQKYRQVKTTNLPTMVQP